LAGSLSTSFLDLDNKQWQALIVDEHIQPALMSGMPKRDN